MNSPLIQLLVLAGIAIFLILRLKSVLGTREGFEKPPLPNPGAKDTAPRRGFEVIEGGPDHDIIDHVAKDSEDAKALAAMKRVEPDFNVADFMQGARGAYEMILMGFERGNLDAADTALREVEDLLNRGIDCGALVDPWNILGFQGNYPLFAAREDSIPDQRIETLLDIMERLFGAFSRALSEAAAQGKNDVLRDLTRRFEGLTTWWDQFDTSGCVGCGRCITWCPVGIDITEEARAIREEPARETAS